MNTQHSAIHFTLQCLVEIVANRELLILFAAYNRPGYRPRFTLTIVIIYPPPPPA